MNKYLKFLLIGLVFFNTNVQAQFGQYGHNAFLSRQTSYYKHYPYVQTLASVDTLTNTDSSFAQWNMPNDYTMQVDVWVTRISGTVAGAAYLQGLSLPATSQSVTSTPSPADAAWRSLTGNTTYCSGCVGASATITGSGTTHYTFIIPKGMIGFNNYQLLLASSGTCTFTYYATLGYKN